MAGYDPDVFGTSKPTGLDPDVFGSVPARPALKIEEPTQKGSGSVPLDAANAGATGFWRGLVRLAGLPVDTVANVVDLGKAALGAPYIAATGKPVPEWLELEDRSKTFGTGDNLLEHVRRTETGRAMVDPGNPDYEGGLIQAAGGGAAAAIGPGGAAQIAKRGVAGASASTAGQFVYDKTGSPATAILASMTPAGVAQAGGVAGRAAIRGGEQGRQNMARRVAELQAAGINEPTLGLASGNKFIGGIENLIQNTPGAVGKMARARADALAGMQGKASEAADLASTNRGEFAAGSAVQQGLRQFRDDLKTRQGGVWSAFDTLVPPDQPMGVNRTLGALSHLNADIPGAPQLSKQFLNGRMQGIEAAMQSDLSPTGTLPFQAVQKTRTLVGNEIADTNLASAVPRSKWNPLYGALSEDLKGAAAQVGPDASRAFNRANVYTRAGLNRLDRVDPFANAASPERAFESLLNAAKGSPSTFQAVKKAIGPDARGSVAGTVIERLGRAAPGQQNAEGSVWSHERFLNNWNSLGGKGQAEILSGFPNAGEVKRQVEAVAKAASMMRENSRLWANPSGTAAAGTARTILLGAPLTAGISPWAPAAVGTWLDANRLTAGLLTNPATMRWAQERSARRGLLAPTFGGMQGGGLLSGPLAD